MAAPALAVGNTLRIESPTNDVAVGGSFTVRVVGNAEVPTSGAQATVTFDQTLLQITSVTRGTPYAGASVFLGAGAAAIASANVDGSLNTVAAGFFSPDVVPAGDADFLRITFGAIACGSSDLGLPVGPADASLLDGRPATYGDTLAVTTTGGSVTIPCGAGTAAATPAAAAKPSPAQASAATAGTCPITIRVEGSSTVKQANAQAEPGFESLWAPGTAVDLAVTGANASLDALRSGTIQVAGIDRGLTAAEQTEFYAWRIGSSSGPTPLFLVVRKPGLATRIDNSNVVRGDDFVNYMLSAAGQAAIAGLVDAGFKALPTPPAKQPILDSDINLDGTHSIGDLGAITGRWALSTTCKGWIRADANNDGTVSIGDIGQITGRWGLIGFQPPPIVTASTSECGELGPVNRHTGWLKGGTFTGIRANLDGRSLDVCTGGFPLTGEVRGSFAFVNIEGPDVNDIVQIGRGRCYDATGIAQCDGNQNYIWAWGRGSCGLLKWPTPLILGPAPEVTETYVVEHNSLTSSWRGYIDGSFTAEVSDTEICWTPTEATWFTETWDIGDALGGSAEDRYRISNMAVQQTQGGAYQSLSLTPGPNCNLTEPEAMFKCTILTSTSLETWTAR